MSDLETAHQAAQMLPAVVGAAGGGLGVLWLARLLFKRMIDQYDRRHDEQAKKLERVGEKFEHAIEALGSALAGVDKKVAVLESMLADTRTIRTDVATQVAAMQEGLANLRASVTEALRGHRATVVDLADDIRVAHRRLELVAKGDMDITKVQKTPRR